MRIITSTFFFLFTLPIFSQQLKSSLSSVESAIYYDFQDDEYLDEETDIDQGWSIGINLGMYFANKKSANLYNGTCSIELIDAESGLRCYDIETRLGINGGVFGVNTYNQLVNDLESQEPGVTGVRGRYDMHPYNMRYTGSFLYGLNITYNFNSTAAIVINSNLMQLKSKDAFILILEGISPQPNEPEAIRLYTVWGEESRFNLQLGYKQGWEINDNARWIFEFGGNVLGSSVQANKILVAGREYDLLVGGDNPANQYAYVPRTQVGIGTYFAPGLEFDFQDKYKAVLGVSFMRDIVKLETYEAKLWNSSIFLRVGL